MQIMANLIKQGRYADEIMPMYAAKEVNDIQS
jgi:hypothetical protein